MGDYFRCAVLVILLIGLFHKSNCADFHVTKIITAKGASKNVHNVVGLGTNTMAVIEGSLSNCTITVLGGNGYDTELFKSQEEGLMSQPKFQGESGVVVNKGYFLYSKNYGKFTEYKNFNISGNIVIGRENTLFSESRECPTLTYLGSYRNIQSKTFGTAGQCLSYAPGFISQYKNGYLVYAVKHSVLMLQRYNNFFVLQNFTQEPEFRKPEYEYSQVQSYFDNKTNQLTVLTRYSGTKNNNYGILHSTANGPLTKSTYDLFNPTSSLYLTGLNSGVSFSQDYIHRWQKIDGITISMDFTTTTEPLNGTKPTCVSTDETYFIQHALNKIFIYDLPEGQTNITKRNELQLGGIDYVVNGGITKNNSLYILNVVKNTKYRTFCRIMSADLQVKCLNEVRSTYSQPQPMNTRLDQPTPLDIIKENNLQELGNQDSMKVSVNSQGYLSMSQQDIEQIPARKSAVGDAHYYNCPLWALYSTQDLLVAACNNETSKLTQLHLYKMSTLELITAQNVYIGKIPTPFEIKLIRNQYKQQNDPSISDRPLFLVVLKISTTYDDAVTFRYIVQRSNFIAQNPPSYDISFQNVYAYGRFIASIKLKNATHQTNALRFFDFTSLKLIKQVPYDDAAISGNYHLNGYRNILMVVQNFGLHGTHFYDLKKYPNDDNWERGISYNQYFTNQLDDPTFGQYLIFPKRNLQLFYRYLDTQQNQPLKQILDISVCPIEERTRMQGEPIQKVDIYAYLKPEIYVTSRECEIVFYVTDGKWLHKFEDCEQKTTATKYDLNPTNRTGTFEFDFVSESDSKDSIVLKYTHTTKTNKFDIIQVRVISSPQKIVWSSNKTTTAQPLQFVNYIQTIYGTSAVQGYRTKLTHQDIQQINNSSYFELLDFDDVDVAQQCLVLCGQTQQSGGATARIYYSGPNFIESTPQTRKTTIEDLEFSEIEVQNDSVKNILISKDCSKIAALTKKSTLLVWNNTELKLLKNITNQNYVDIQFSGSAKIVVKTTTGVEFISLDPALNQAINVAAITSKVAASSDGLYYAVSTEPLVVEIKTSADEQIRTFKVPIDETTKNQNIVSLSFGQSNNLLVGLSNSQIYVLSPTPCPEPFINQNGVCICQANQTLVNDNCECRNHFIPDGNTCICDKQKFVFENGQCACSANSSQVQGKCICHDNFIQDGVHCTCPGSFEFDSTKLICTCPYGYVDKQECIGCSFPCSTCDSSSECTSYQATFYLLVIGGGVLVLAVIAGVVVCYMKKKKINQKSELLKQEGTWE